MDAIRDALDRLDPVMRPDPGRDIQEAMIAAMPLARRVAIARHGFDRPAWPSETE